MTAGAAPWKPAAGAKVIVPSTLAVYVPAAVVSVVTSAPAPLTSRSELGTSGALGAPGASLASTLVVTEVWNGVLAVSFAAVGVIGVTVIVIVEVAVAPLASATRYGTGVAVPVNVATGVNVTAPVVVLTVYVPCALVSVVTGVPPSSSRTEVGTIAAPVGPGVSLAAGLTVIGVLCGVVPVSGFATGAAGAPTVTV